MVYNRINATRFNKKRKLIFITDSTTTNQNELLAKGVVGCPPEEIPISRCLSIRDLTVGGKHLEAQAWNQHLRFGAQSFPL